MKLLKARHEVVKYNKILTLFPKEGKYSRDKYKKAMNFYKAGATYKERAFMGGNRCLGKGTLVHMSNGKQKPIEEVKLGDKVLAYDIDKDSLVPVDVIDTFKGYADNIVSFKVGNDKITCTDDHPFLHKGRTLKKRYIKDIQNLKHRSQIVVPQKWETIEVSPEYSPNVARLIGYLIGDGGLTQDCVRFTNEREEYHSDVASIAEELGLHTRRYGSDAYLSVKNGVKGQNPLINLLRRLNLWKKTCHNKNIPEELLNAPLEYVNNLLIGLIATDGSVSKNRVCYYSCSKQLLEDIRTLLWRIGARSYIYHRKTHKGIPQYELKVSRSDSYKLPTVDQKDNLLDSPKRVSSKHRIQRITQYKKEKPQDIYCITVNHPDHLFVANGIISGNSGKTFSASVEIYYHASGKYPDWWEGRRYSRPLKIYVGSETNKQIREGVQEILTGGLENIGTGIIPKDEIVRIAKAANTNDTLDNLSVRHKNGGVSKIHIMTYKQGREVWQGFKADIIWFDEEPPRDIYSEGIVRTINERGDGIIILTFTPLKGLSEVARMYLPDGRVPKVMENRYIDQVAWDDVPHIQETDKKALIASMSPTEIEARTKGIPCAGSGAVYPISDDQIAVDPFKIPPHWPRFFGFDYGFHKTAAVFFAEDPISHTLYIYDTYTSVKGEPQDHYMGLRQRGGDWMVGASESALRYGDKKWIDVYIEDFGLNLIPAEKAVEAGLTKCHNLMVSGKLKVFNTCRDWFMEKNLYHREEKKGSSGDYAVKKDYDDLMDATRYGIVSGIPYARINPIYVEDDRDEDEYYNRNGHDPITGY